MKKNSKNITIVGATGNVGRMVTELLLQRNLVEAHQLKLTASPQSAGKTISVAGSQFIIEATHEKIFAQSDICIFNTESEISSRYVPIALDAGAYVIDTSSHYRLYENIPLIIPPVNREMIRIDQKMYALANCLASPIAVALAPLHKTFGIKRINATTYQSTSGAGKKSMDECWLETSSFIKKEPYQRSCFQRQIAFNVIPQVGIIHDDGYTSEEYKIIHELRKVLGHEIVITSTAVRVPVMIGHSIALSLELGENFELQQVIKILKNSPNVQLSSNHYSTPIEVVGSDDVFVGRMRKDHSLENGLHLWLCSDNLRRGAATDTVEVISHLLSHYESLENYQNKIA